MLLCLDCIDCYWNCVYAYRETDIYLRGFDSRDHFYTVLVSLKRRVLYEGIGKYSNLKTITYTVGLQISEARYPDVSVYEWLLGGTEFISVTFCLIYPEFRVPDLDGLFYNKTLFNYKPISQVSTLF